MAVEDKSLPAAGDDALSPPPLQPLQQLDGAGHGGASGNGSGNGNGNGGETEAPISGPSFAKQATSLSVSRYLKEKEQEWKAVSERSRPLTLLELPVDILSLVVKEITHTNDLTALALTNSTLHSLAMPHIYARFDIVWPDGHITASESKSVDALTYGLSTLCLGSSFAGTTRRFLHPGASSSPLRFRGNDYAKYTRKFSLGNGPNDWVAEYMITKESGKMLGTLVALAVAKMDNLETFVWDMPTGVLSDIFMALASLDEPARGECKLDRVWIRWHDNSDNLLSSSTASVSPSQQAPVGVPHGSTLTPIGIMLPPNATHPTPRPAIPYSEHHVEYPTFSVLPSLKSLTVLDIDELSYLDEMASLIERSRDRLQELRVGIAAKAMHKDFVQTWDGSGLRQIDHRARWPGESTIGERRLGGVLGVLVGKIYDIKKRKSTKSNGELDSPSSSATSSDTPVPGTPAAAQHLAAEDGTLPLASTSSTLHVPATETDSSLSGTSKKGPRVALPKPKPSKPSASSSGRKRLDGKLKLQTLELERVPLSMQVCRHAIDWSVLSTLTILDCAQNETLWKMLRKQFQPTPMGSLFGISASSRPLSNAPLQYHLALKRIHTDVTSSSLISFVKETLAPNSLEILFLQDRRRTGTGPPPVTIDQIFRGAIKRHRSSLRKLLLDSSHRPASADNVRWRNWVLTSEILHYITSGRLANLRELAVALDYKDWHTFLQRLPNMPQLRSINIPHIAEHAVANFEPKELAMQIADIITLRPEVQLCYVGISTKCFELLETRDSSAASSSARGSSAADPMLHNGDSQDNSNGSATSSDVENDEGEGESSDEEAMDEEPGTESDLGADDTPASPTDPDETQSENNGDDDSDGGDSDDGFVEPDRGRVKIRLREILFYDDKVAIFKARHGKL